MQKAGFYLIENPIKVYWGDISLVKVEYLLSNQPYHMVPMLIIIYYPERICP